MSIHSITIAEFMALTPKQLRLAIRLCDAEISSLYDHARQLGPKDESYGHALEDIATAITLRAVHKGRLDELEAEAVTEAHGSSVPSEA
ncbi:hypothetical protein [Hymenobacter terricola]|uniref:hypothetical protein n=1 Tax=Hymenobacter terricola TaxID=2819236 RepID=UPI001B3127DB|nr:hypothetical protein [Hymenobacter terricola]